jgi:NAD(P)-dependent dehydrogenase (short-subunit alcohol dehydrogenase family)
VIDRQTARADVSSSPTWVTKRRWSGGGCADRLDGLVCGRQRRDRRDEPILDLTTDEWDRVMSVNLRGAFVTLRESARAMVARERPGAIVAVTSVSGFLTDRSMAHYSVSKAGLAALVRVAAREFGPYGIRVNGVAPGTTDTPMFKATDALRGYRERVAERSALGRVGTAHEVAQAIVGLCTLDWVTGQVVAADGGVSLASPIDPTDRDDRA